jgi:HAD superfamily hydrolase (TIGR01490 family)
MTKRKFAAFDIDGTLGRSSLFLDVVDELLSKNHISDTLKDEFIRKKKQYRERAHSQAYKEYSALSVEILLGNMTKLKVEDFKSAVDAVISRNKSEVYVYTRDLVKKLKNEGYFLIALSGSEMYTVQEYTKQFGFDIAVGEYYHQKNGLFTGEIDEVFHKKDIFIKKIVADNNLTFKGSYAVGDSMGDYSMLEIADNPIVFNPEDTLFAKAKENGWKIVLERKNVVYELEERDGHFILA